MPEHAAQTDHIARRAPDAPRPLSFPQERLFVLDRIMPGLPAYNVPTLVRLTTTLDDDLLAHALNTVVARHEILRTSIALVDGEPVQVVRPRDEVDLAVWDLRDAPVTDRLLRAQELLGAVVRKPFDLSADVLLRAGLVHVAPGEDLLLIVFHHIASDHVSASILFKELEELHAAGTDGREPALPDLPVQYADYAAAQREHLARGLEDELLEYWTGKLAGAPDRLELPTDRPRPSAQSYRGALREFTLPPALTQTLRELARREGVSPFMLLLAAFNTLLHRYSSAEDIVVGVPVSGRHREEIASLLGYFSNTLALRTDLSGDPRFSELLAQVKLNTLEAQIYQELPFERLVEVLNPERAQSHSPLFQVLFGYDVAPAQPLQLAGRAIERLPVPGWEWSRFDLSMVVREVPDGSLHAQLEYATDLFDSSTMERLIGHFTTLLGAIAVAPETRLSELPLLTDAEQHELARGNDTARSYDKRCLHELFSDQAARTPDAVAVAAGEERISFTELERSSNQLARELQQRGLGPGELAGICVERSIALVVAMLAVLKTGAAYVPIEPTYPPQRQEFMLADAGAVVLITQERFLGVIGTHGTPTLSLDSEADRCRVLSHSAQPISGTSDPEQRAYVIYTSGSTGQPKGVEIRHVSVANLIAHMRERPGIGPGDVLANLTTPAFDLSVPDWYLPLATGARLVIVPREATLDGVDLADWLARTGATFVQATPTTWQLLVEAGWKGSPALKIVCGGEALPRALAQELLDRGASLWHMYGPTETTVWSSVLQLTHESGPVPIGGPIANTTFSVLQSGRRPVPVGVAGELCIGGDGLALGYRHRSELTAEKFIFDHASGRRLYRTGDLVRWRHGGTLEFLGRIDQQVKLRGFRIELGEIEAVLDTHPDVGASAVVVREDSPGDQRLAAYLVATAGRTVDADDLRRLLKSKLPPFMVPSAFVTLDAFPVTANGKLDRKALPRPDGARSGLVRTYVPPETPVEQTLASVWSEVLGVDRVGVQDDFFDLGGHSLLAVKMLAKVQEQLGLELYLGSVFEHATIRGLAGTISAQLLGNAGDDELAALLAEVEATPG